jgi:hypothetical protein
MNPAQLGSGNDIKERVLPADALRELEDKVPTLPVILGSHALY